MSSNARFFCAIFIAWLPFMPLGKVGAQSLKQQSEIKPLSVGDRCPDIVLKKMLRYKSRTARLSDFSGKLIVFDFWATWCSGCIEFLPTLDSIQHRQQEIATIISVTDEKEEKIKKFLTKNPLVKNLKLPIVVEDTILSKYFPHFIIPHEVWIQDGVVLAITAGEYVNERNIQQLHKEKTFASQWPVKRDLMNFDRKKPLIDLHGLNVAQVNYSALTSFIEGVPFVNQGIRRDSSANYLRLYAINFSIPRLYGMAVGEELQPGIPMTKRILIETHDSSRYFKPDSVYASVWQKPNEYTYEAIMPMNTTDQEARERMFNDLNFYLGLNAEIQLRKTDCLIIKNTGAGLQPNLDPNVPQLSDLSSEHKRLQNVPLDNLTDAMNTMPGGPVVINETGYVGSVNFDLGNVHLDDVQGMNQILKKYGLMLSAEQRQFKVLVIEEKPNHHSSDRSLTKIFKP